MLFTTVLSVFEMKIRLTICHQAGKALTASCSPYNNWGYPDSVKPKTFLLTDGDYLLTREGPEKVGSFYSKTPTLITETGQKCAHLCVAQSSATVDHVVYLLLEG